MPPYIIAQWVERVSDLIVYYTGSEGGGAVDSVNGQTGVVVIDLDYLPLAGGTMDAGADIFFDNGSALREGTYDFGGDGGISRICSVDYEDMWQAGIRHVFDNNGLIRHSTNCFDVIPDSSFDNTLRFKVDSLWTLDNGTTYKCTDASTGAAVWEIYHNFIPNLTQVLTVGDKEFQQINLDRDFEFADRLKYSLITGGMTMTLDDDSSLFPDNSLIQFFVANDTLPATATLNITAGTQCYYLSENITTLTLNVGDFCELKKATGSSWLLNVWNKSSGGGGVPYTGATQDVDLGEFGLLTGNIEFDNTPTNIPTAAGSMVWNDTDGTLDLKLKGGNVTLQIGQENVLRVVNKTATNVNLLEANYQAVRVTGAQGQRLKVDLAQATTDTLSAETIGLVTETINNNQEGFITTSGLIRGINTTGSLQSETWADGDILYLSPTVAGQLTKVKPTAPNHLVIIGYVIHAHATQGSIFVKVDNGYELDELHNVKITTAANGQALTYTSATDIWENKTIIEDAIVNGVTTVAPSQNAVFDALALKQNNFILGRKASASSTLTGTTTETILESIFVPAGSVAVGDVIYIRNRVFKTGNLGGFSYRYRINSSNSISGSSVLGLVNLALGSVRAQGSERTLNLRTGNVIEVIDNTTSYAYENSSPLNANTNITLTYTSDFWILITATLGNASDSIVNSNYIIQKF
jgi:hypothetical protein